MAILVFFIPNIMKRSTKKIDKQIDAENNKLWSEIFNFCGNDKNTYNMLYILV